MATVRILRDGTVHADDIENLDNFDIYKRVVKNLEPRAGKAGEVETIIYRVGKRYIEYVPHNLITREQANDVTAAYEGMEDVIEEIEVPE